MAHDFAFCVCALSSTVLKGGGVFDAANAACLAYAADERALPPTTNGDVDVLFAPEEESWD